MPALSRARREAAAAWDAWSVAAGPWARWSQCLPLLGPGLDEMAPPLAQPPPASQVADRLVAWLGRRLSGTPMGTQVVLDLPPATGVRVAGALAARAIAHPLLLLGRWPYAQALLSARPLVDVLLAEAKGLAPISAPNVVLVLDGERNRPLAGRSRAHPLADNRFGLDSDDLPDAATLLAAGIGLVVVLRWGRQAAPGPAQDAYAAYAAYMAAGLTVQATAAR